jgi:hypothetical protein
VDTFYREKLRQELDEKFKASKFAVIAYVDSISNFTTYDTTFYHGVPYYVDSFHTEKVWVSIAKNLKESLPAISLSFTDRWVAAGYDRFSTTYMPMLDTPFVAFFDRYDSIHQIGIGPMDGCFFEPTAYFVISGQIIKKGMTGSRMPGVGVAWLDFLKTIQLPESAPPEVQTSAIRRGSFRRIRKSRGTFIPKNSGHQFNEGFFGKAFDLRGRLQSRP